MSCFNPDDFDFFSDENDLAAISEAAFTRLSFTFTRGHLERVIKATLAPNASENDRYVCACILKNAQVAAQGTFPLCQDTGIATVFGWNNARVLPADAGSALSRGAAKTYDTRRLRFSTSCPSSFYDEFDPKNNMPAQVSIFERDAALAPPPPFALDAPLGSLALLFCAKGGGSSNKTSFIQGTKAFLTRERFTTLMREQIAAFGTSACPPYTIAVVAGGLSPEQNLLTLKLATMGAYDELTHDANADAFRDAELESLAMQIAAESGYGAQFGGRAFALEAIVIRLPRHGASCPISFGVSCSAHRNLRSLVTKNGFYLQKTAAHPEEIPGFAEAVRFADGTQSARTAANPGTQAEIALDTADGIPALLASLATAKPGDRVLLSGNILVARDAAHARWQKLLDAGNPLPAYAAQYPICYAGPARTPDGAVIGSFGPTTAGRMDVYAESLMSRGAALITLAKGNRGAAWTQACAKYGAVYLGTPGGIAALIASEYITAQKVIDYEDLGMEAVRLVTVQKLPCFVVTDAHGNDFYENVHKKA